MFVITNKVGWKTNGKVPLGMSENGMVWCLQMCPMTWGALLQPSGDRMPVPWNILVNIGHGEAAVAERFLTT